MLSYKYLTTIKVTKAELRSNQCYVHTFMYVYTHICINTHIYTHVYLCIHIYFTSICIYNLYQLQLDIIPCPKIARFSLH